MPRELQNVKVTKISLVFRPANGDAIRITKSKATAERTVDRKLMSAAALRQRS